MGIETYTPNPSNPSNPTLSILDGTTPPSGDASVAIQNNSKAIADALSNLTAAIATANGLISTLTSSVAGKAALASPATSGHLATLTSSGGISDSGSTVASFDSAGAATSAVATHAALTAAHGATGAVVGTTNSQTLTNKTISGASNTFSNIPESAVTDLSSDLALLAPLANPTFSGGATVQGYYFINFALNSGGGIASQTSSTNLMQMGFNAQGQYGGTSGQISGSQFFIYNFQDSVGGADSYYMGCNNSGDFFYGPSGSSYSLKISQPHNGGAVVTANSTLDDGSGNTTIGGNLSFSASGGVTFNTNSSSGVFLFQNNGTPNFYIGANGSISTHSQILDDGSGAATLVTLKISGSGLTFSDSTTQTTAYLGAPTLNSVLSASADGGGNSISNVGGLGSNSDLTLSANGGGGNLYLQGTTLSVNGSEGFNGSGSYTSFTIVNGLITNAS